MKRPEQTVQRSYAMMVASYWLSRCGDVTRPGPARPPSILGVRSWKQAYDLFFELMADGRGGDQFRNSMKNTRDTFDVLHDNGRVGWVDKIDHGGSLSQSFLRIHEEWKDRPDEELTALVMSLMTGLTTGDEPLEYSGEARTEGGEVVYVSRRRERDPALRQDALRIHGEDCMGCGFNFGKAYGTLGRGYIEVHHAVPLSKSGRRLVDPKTDLIVLCANCHRMVHRSSKTCLSLEELRSHLGSA